ncbi:MAG: cell division protein FtsW [Phycisphaerales bacterium]|nr:cell division protein FtsW [Phycisphaerales bacterium]
MAGPAGVRPAPHEDPILSDQPTSLFAAPGPARRYDPVIVFIAGVLMTLGVAMVYSASTSVQSAPFDWRQWWDTPLRQGVFALVGFAVMIAAAHVDHRVLAWERPGDGWRVVVLVLLTVALLVGVLVPGIGREVLGARRQIFIPGLGRGFQPSELAKVVLVVWTAALLSRPASRRMPESPLREPALPARARRGRAAPPAPPARPARRERVDPTVIEHVDPRSLTRSFLPAVLSGGLMIGLTAIEDFGTAALMGVVWFIMLFIAGVRWLHLLSLMCLGGVAAVGLVIMEPYRVTRVTTFLSEAPDPMGAGYQVDQALLAIGSGGWWGRGLGAGVQKYGYLPQDNNDFILAIICEELGAAGGFAIVALFLLFLWRGWRLARRAPGRFGQLVAVGLTLTICLQAAFNVGVVTNSVPTKGISLPFVSAGGSGVVFLGLAAGLLASVGRREAAPVA